MMCFSQSRGGVQLTMTPFATPLHTDIPIFEPTPVPITESPVDERPNTGSRKWVWTRQTSAIVCAILACLAVWVIVYFMFAKKSQAVAVSDPVSNPAAQVHPLPTASPKEMRLH